MEGCDLMVFKDVLYSSAQHAPSCISCDLMVFKDVLYCGGDVLNQGVCCDLMVFKDVLYWRSSSEYLYLVVI